jgi:hypothetical protein
VLGKRGSSEPAPNGAKVEPAAAASVEQADAELKIVEGQRAVVEPAGASVEPVEVEPAVVKPVEPWAAEVDSGPVLYRFAVDSLAELSTQLRESGAGDTDLILVVPAAGATVLAEADELVDAATLMGGICVAVSAVPLASPAVAQSVEAAVADATDSPMLRCHPHPYGLVGPAGPIRSLLADMAEGGSDADRLTTAVLSGRHDVVLDVSSQFFHVLDGTGTDLIMDDGRAYAGAEQPLVVIHLDPNSRAAPPRVPDRVEQGDPEQRFAVPWHSADGFGLYTLRVDSLAQLSSELKALNADDADVVLVLPDQGALVAAEPDELIDAARLSGGICVAASPVALASPNVAQQVELAVAAAAGSPVLRCHPYPCGLLGPAGPLRALLADLVGSGSDANQLTAVVLSGSHDMVLDISSQVFHVLDGSGTDVVVIAGRAHAGDEQPLVLIDPSRDGRALALIKPQPLDTGDVDAGGLPSGDRRGFELPISEPRSTVPREVPPEPPPAVPPEPPPAVPPEPPPAVPPEPPPAVPPEPPPAARSEVQRTVPARCEPDPVDGSARDLVRLLRYQGAIASTGEVTAAAPDVLVMPLWTPEFCAAVVRTAEAAALWEKLPDEPPSTTGTWLHDLVPRLLVLLESDVQDRIWPLLQAEWPGAVATPLHGALVLRCEASGQGKGSDGHHDVAQLSGSVRLNDGYLGGALLLPRQHWDDGAAPVGALGVWPALLTHPYDTGSVTRGVKYRLALWWGLPAA